jgi:transcriptional regulator with XRE-family HTH domain
MKIGENIKNWREFRKITPKDMADRLDMSIQGYLKIEREELDVKTDKIKTISSILDVEPAMLFTDFNDNNVVYVHNQDILSNRNGILMQQMMNEEIKKYIDDLISSKEKIITALENQVLMQNEHISLLKSQLRSV